MNILANPLFKDVDYIINSGGEPSLCNLKNVLEMENKILPNATLQVSTNGLLPEKIESAVEHALSLGARVDVGISLDGIGRAHDRIRGVPGNFNKVNSLIDSLLALKVEYPKLAVMVGSTLTAKTVEHCNDLLFYAEEKKVNFLWHWYNSSAFYNNTQNKSAASNLGRFYKAVTEVMPDSVYRDAWLQSLSGNMPRFDCYSLRSFAVLRCTGDIVPCLSHWNDSIGNIMEEDPQTVWHSKKAQTLRKMIHTCGHKGCLNNWGFGWSIEDKHFPVMLWALKKRYQNSVRASKRKATNEPQHSYNDDDGIHCSDWQAEDKERLKKVVRCQ